MRVAFRWIVLHSPRIIFWGGLSAFVGLWLALHYRPGWYRPAQLDEAGVQRARKDAVATADSVSDRIVTGEPFDVVLQDRSVNEWLSALPTVWPEANEVLGRHVSQIALSFEEGRAHVGCHFASRYLQSIVNATVLVGVSAEGNALRLTLSGLYGGSLPIPRRILAEVLGAWGRQADQSSTGSSEAADVWRNAVRVVRTLDKTRRGLEVENRFVWFNGRRPFRLMSVNIERGAIRLRIEPLGGTTPPGPV